MTTLARELSLTRGGREFASPAFDERELRIERGSLSDYAPLAASHYKGARVRAVDCVYALTTRRPTVVGRFLGRSEERQVAGVLVVSYPPFMCALRDFATSGRYSTLSLRERSLVLNREMRTISRVVLDPRYRGLGLATRLVRHALDHAETIYTEALAAMGRINPFFERAGMTRYDRPPHPASARLLDAMRELDLDPVILASSEKRVSKRLAMRSEAQRAFFEVELERWARSMRLVDVRSRSVNGVRSLVELARDHLLTNPVYYLSRRDEPEA